MPALKYFDQATQTYKYVVGGMTQDEAVKLTGRRNVIRNGDMQIYQRGNGPFTNLNSTAMIDGYWSNCNGGTFTINRVAQAVGAGSAMLQCQTSGQALAAHYSVVWPYIEGVETLSGKTVTLSFDAFAASGLPQIGICIEHYYGVSGSATVDYPMGRVQITQTKKRYSITFLMPSVTGKTLGANNCIYVGFYLSAGADNALNASSIGIQNNTISITDIQLEEGSVATPFERLPVVDQLAWCQRYFIRLGQQNPFYVGSGDGYFGNTFALSNVAGYVMIQFPQVMRCPPTLTNGGFSSTFYASVSNSGNWVSGFGAPGGTISFGPSGGFMALNYPAVGVPGDGGFLTGNGRLDFSAEL